MPPIQRVSLPSSPRPSPLYQHLVWPWTDTGIQKQYFLFPRPHHVLLVNYRNQRHLRKYSQILSANELQQPMQLSLPPARVFPEIYNKNTPELDPTLKVEVTILYDVKHLIDNIATAQTNTNTRHELHAVYSIYRLESNGLCRWNILSTQHQLNNVWLFAENTTTWWLLWNDHLYTCKRINTCSPRTNNALEVVANASFISFEGWTFETSQGIVLGTRARRGGGVHTIHSCIFIQRWHSGRRVAREVVHKTVSTPDESKPLG